MARPRLLDLFCGAGGAAMGYHRAGFDVVGVDVADQPAYPFTFHRGDAMTWPLEGFDAVHASPPCQAFTSMSNRWRARSDYTARHVDLLGPTLERFAALTVPWVVENVPGAAAGRPGAVVLHGGMFGLGVHRPRLFWSNMLLLAPRAGQTVAAVGVYGKRPDGRRLWRNADGHVVLRAARSLDEARTAMGMDWADWHGTTQAVPPAYTEHIGAQLLGAVQAGTSSARPGRRAWATASTWATRSTSARENARRVPDPAATVVGETTPIRHQ